MNYFLEKPLTLKLLKKDLNWKLALNPDLNFPEAYMRGEILIENGSLLDFLHITFENIGRKEINLSARVCAVSLEFIDRFLESYIFLNQVNCLLA